MTIGGSGGKDIDYDDLPGARIRGVPEDLPSPCRTIAEQNIRPGLTPRAEEGARQARLAYDAFIAALPTDTPRSSAP